MADTPGTVKFPADLDSAESLIQTANNASTVLTANATNSATTLTVSSTAAFPNTGALSVEGEVIFYTGKTSTTFTGCLRGRDGTTAAAHTLGAAVAMLIVSAHHSTLANAIIQTETKLGSGGGAPTTSGTVLRATGAGTSAWSSVAGVIGAGSSGQLAFWSCKG